jgi:hypothetical protein
MKKKENTLWMMQNGKETQLQHSSKN